VVNKTSIAAKFSVSGSLLMHQLTAWYILSLLGNLVGKSLNPF